MVLQWSAITYYAATKLNPAWNSKFITDDVIRIQNEFTIETKAKENRPPLAPFMLYFRGMEKTSADSKHKAGFNSYSYDFSRLSEGIKCASQGCKYFFVFSNQIRILSFIKLYKIDKSRKYF